MLWRPEFFGALGRAPASFGVTFVSQASFDAGLQHAMGSARRLTPVRGARGLTKSSLYGNSAAPPVRVDPETLAVAVDGVQVSLSPADSLPLTRLFFLI